MAKVYTSPQLEGDLQRKFAGDPEATASGLFTWPSLASLPISLEQKFGCHRPFSRGAPFSLPGRHYQRLELLSQGGSRQLRKGIAFPSQRTLDFFERGKLAGARKLKCPFERCDAMRHARIPVLGVARRRPYR